MNQNKTELRLGSQANPEITFKPITEGLGFHPFSDGLPYAPISKSTQKNPLKSPPLPTQSLSSALKGDGAGAGHQISVPIVQKSFTFNPAASSSRSSSPLKPRSSSSSTQSGSASFSSHGGDGVSPTQNTHSTSSPYYFLKRASAYLLDTVLAGILSLAGLSALVIKNEMNFDAFLDPSVLLLTLLFMMTMNWLFMTLQEICFGNTLGKKAFGLRLGGKKRFRILRALLFVPSIGFLGFGLWLGFFDRRKRCWHDRLANLQPVEVSNY